MASVNELMSAFAVAPPQYDGGRMSMSQRLTHAVADHRGRVEMPAYAVMVEAVTNGIFWHSFNEPVGTVQSWLSLTAGAPVEVNQRLLATSELLHSDDAHGATTVRITNDSHDVVCAGVARCVLVGRTSAALASIKEAGPTEAEDVVPEAAAVAMMPPPIDPGLDGKQILSAISDGGISAGPICQLLSATVTSSEDRIRLTVSPQPWMANPLGAMQGGVIAAIAGQACSLAGQLHTGPGQQYSLADLTVHYFRSPPVDEALTVVTAPDRIGRRLGTVSATMTGSDGVLFARATASIRYH